MSHLSVQYTGHGDRIRIEDAEDCGSYGVRSNSSVTCNYYELKELLTKLERTLPPRCPACSGSGEVTFPTEEGQDEVSPCPVCEGTRVAV
jgi:DnaJ-class molecular chaperone